MFAGMNSVDKTMNEEGQLMAERNEIVLMVWVPLSKASYPLAYWG